MIFLWRRRAVTLFFTRAMCQRSSEVREHAGDATCVFRSHVVGGTKAALALGRLLREDVALERVAALELAARGLAEPLRGGPVGLDLRHGRTPVSFLITGPSGSSALHFPSCS